MSVITPEDFLKANGMSKVNTVLVSCIDGAMRNPDLHKLLEDYAAIKIKELDLRITPEGGLEDHQE